MGTTKTAVKRPQDHKAKTATTPLDPKPITITVRGVTATITRETLDSSDFLLHIAELESAPEDAKSASLMFSVLLDLVGPRTARELSRAAREPGQQRTTIEQGITVIGEVFAALREAGVADPTGSPEPSGDGAIPS